MKPKLVLTGRRFPNDIPVALGLYPPIGDSPFAYLATQGWIYKYRVQYQTEKTR